MEGHKYFIEGIPKALWKEFQIACIYFDTTAKDHLITCMSHLVFGYHKARHNHQAGPVYKSRKEKKK